MISSNRIIIDIKCPECGRKGDIGANYCRICGAALVKNTFCKQCGSLFRESVYFRCPRCKHKGEEGEKYCSKCGASLQARYCCATCGADFRAKYQMTESSICWTKPLYDQSKTKKKNCSGGFFQRLMRGDFGLARTYWLYGVLVNIGFGILASLMPWPQLIMILLILSIAYYIPLTVGIWCSASRYTGSKVWAVLAKIIVVLGIWAYLMLIISVIVGL